MTNLYVTHKFVLKYGAQAINFIMTFCTLKVISETTERF